jgi:hypothetical protein
MSDQALILAALKSCRHLHDVVDGEASPPERQRPLWVIVRDLFCVGSTSAADLCRRFNLDPDEMVPAEVRLPPPECCGKPMHYESDGPDCEWWECSECDTQAEVRYGEQQA